MKANIPSKSVRSSDVAMNSMDENKVLRDAEEDLKLFLFAFLLKMERHSVFER